ncbi:MAG: DUF86 domain-containing protein [Fimbriimonadales bacterium]|nr:DUF86 domain-containing protein [Fimbriimonadales bacterium]
MRRRDYRLFLQDMLVSARDAQEFIQDMSLEEFLSDRKTQNAVVRAIEIVGEAAKNIPKSVRDKYPDIPWSDVARMRDKVAHGYWGVDYEMVWKVVREEFPSLIPKIEAALRQERGEESS